MFLKVFLHDGPNMRQEELTSLFSLSLLSLSWVSLPFCTRMFLFVSNNPTCG